MIIQNITLKAVSNSKQPETGSLIQDMTDSGLKSHIVILDMTERLNANAYALLKPASLFLLHTLHFNGC